MPHFLSVRIFETMFFLEMIKSNGREYTWCSDVVGNWSKKLLYLPFATEEKNRCIKFKTQNVALHIFLRQISTIKSYDLGKLGYFCNHKVISYHLQLTRGAQPPGQLSLYLLNDINSL